MLEPLPPIAADLAAYLSRWQPDRWDWGTAHCGTFAAGWVAHRTGVHVLAGLDAPDSLIGWARLVRDDMAALVSRRLRVMPVPPAQAVHGDVVLLPGMLAGGALGVCLGQTHAVMLNERAHCVFAPMAAATHAWPLAAVRALETA